MDGHAGIPQEVRLLFNGLRTLSGSEVEGLIQSSGKVLSKGLTLSRKGATPLITPDRQINRLSRVVISLEKSLASPYAAAIKMALWHVLGGRQRLTYFDATHFRDYIWRNLFAKTLSFEDFDVVTKAGFRVLQVPWSAMHGLALATQKIGFAVYPRINTSDFDVLIAETPFPALVSKTTTLVVRYHDAIPILMPHTISDKSYHQASHYRALRSNVQNGAYFACVSEATRSDLISIFPEAESRSTTIHNMVSHHYFPEESSAKRVNEIVSTRKNQIVTNQAKVPRDRLEIQNEQLFDYLLIVSTIEPRKNHTTLLAAWEQLRTECYSKLKLVVVGMLGWDHEPIVKKFLPWVERGELHVLEDVPSPELRLLYKHARATICPSFGEGFDFSGVEAMRSGGAVVASDIAVHREIYAEAAEFFNPYSIGELVKAVVAVVDPLHNDRRTCLVEEGAVVSKRYLPSVILPKWQEFLGALKTQQFRN